MIKLFRFKDTATTVEIEGDVNSFISYESTKGRLWRWASTETYGYHNSLVLITLVRDQFWSEHTEFGGTPGR
jgi:hypothetical protein